MESKSKRRPVRQVVWAVSLVFAGVGLKFLLSERINVPSVVVSDGPQELKSHAFETAPVKPTEPAVVQGQKPSPSNSDISVPLPQLPIPTGDAVYKSPQSIVLAKKVAGRWVSQGDILVGNVIVQKSGDLAGLVELRKSVFWPAGIVPYEIADTGLEGSVREAMKELEAQSPVQFVERTTEEDFVSIVGIDSEQSQCYSSLGRQGGKQEIVLGRACTIGQILHEFMHTLGFLHEHSREDRDQFVDIMWDHIERSFFNQFQKVAGDISIPVAIDFDFDSILMYGSQAFSVDGKPTILRKDGLPIQSQRAALSSGDKRKLESIYGALASKDR